MTNNETFYNVLERLQNKLGLDRKELARRIWPESKDPLATLRAAGRRGSLPMKKLVGLAERHKLSLDEILAEPSVRPQEAPGTDAPPQPTPPYGPGLEPSAWPIGETIPAIDWVHAGAWEEAVQAGETVATMRADRRGFRDVFGLLVRGDSMEPVFSEGDRIAIAPRASVVSGDYVVVMDMRTKEACPREYRRLDGMALLKPLNEKYQPTEVRTEDIRIIGKVIGLERRF